jgi:hypothetical protein
MLGNQWVKSLMFFVATATRTATFAGIIRHKKTPLGYSGVAVAGNPVMHESITGRMPGPA